MSNLLLIDKKMSCLRRPNSYTKIEDEDPDELNHRRAQFLINKILEKADSRRKQPRLRVRICKLKIKIGKRIKKLRRSIQFAVSAARAGMYQPVMEQLKLWRSALQGDHNFHLLIG
ncbi:uncharacterized protein LOC143882609 [Tasmannia lanceolata]|uniref:uncharacterized protein LOC143882609 n=1 Tax=Tasmannia lanceolata TaxID=3420 RepID=UPI00406299DC